MFGLQALADVFRRPVVVDAVVVASGDASRKAFEPKEASTEAGGSGEVRSWCLDERASCRVQAKASLAGAK